MSADGENPKLVGFHGWAFDRILKAYEDAVRSGSVHVRLTPLHEDDIIVVGVDPGSDGGDKTAYAIRRAHTIDVVIIDDPYNNTYEGEFLEVPPREAMSTYAREIQKLPRARAIARNRGPQPRTKYPRRR